MKQLRYGMVVLLLAAGCSSLPGLRVLTGEDSAEVASERVADRVDLVMADKTGDINPSMLRSADRVEAAAGNMDIVQIRQDPLEDIFYIYAMVRTEGDPQSTNTDQVIAYYNSIRRPVELIWRGTMNESRTSNFIQIELVQPTVISSLDTGPVYVGIKWLIMRIDRDDAVEYLAKPHNLDDFIGLVVDGVMSFEPPTDISLYGVVPQEVPNHPAFMLSLTLQ